MIRIKSDELTANILEKILFYEFSQPSGLGGPGCVKMVSNDRESYLMLVEPEWCSCEFYELYKIFPILREYICGTSTSIYYDWQKQQSGWKYYYIGYGSNLLIKNEVYERFMEKYLEAIHAGDIYTLVHWDEIAQESF
ncbi:hypothetical protein H0486_07905 [Lachnospiraceae bacterium MD1]|uniref:Uncharacterized protein n=1 Tax=Variimorphobacter saccharofermentans TaxID=2755051 RepID=A0A839K035_9FIRM|nr:hypothetical protein [Variimorphobacter saccharofermentans]MBB2182798.1 hypothetical protein [Variimorphobacter saccharofermentans]